MNAPHAGGVGGTFGGNPVACARGAGGDPHDQDDGLVERARRSSRRAAATAGAGGARPADRRRPRPGRDAGRRAGRPVDGRTGVGAGEGVAAAAARPRLILLTCGTYGNVLRLLPPLSMPEHLLEEGLDVLEEAFGTAP
jgi:4-aminobutyrate aminotransferase/(S)-3-amino-2-methylpropionate transaminase